MLFIEASQGLDCPVTIQQLSRFKFVVTYGKQITKFTRINDALVEFNDCIIHSVTCTGALG